MAMQKSMAPVARLKEDLKAQKEKIKSTLLKQRANVKRLFKSEFSRFKRLEPKFVSGNNSTFLTGERAYRTMLSALNSARKSINIEMYIFRDDEAGQEISKILKAKVKEGVKVNLLYDAFGSKKTSTGFFTSLKKAGIIVAEHNSINPIKSLKSFLFDLNNRDHRKLIVVDGKTAFIGGMNIGKEFYSNWRDVMVKIEGPIVRNLQILFFQQWRRFELKWLAKKHLNIVEDIEKLDPDSRERYFPELGPAGKQSIAVVAGNPLRAKRAIHFLYLDAVQRAKHNMIFETPYFVPTHSFMTSVIEKLKQGVHVKIIIPDYKFTDRPLLNLVSYRYVRKLMKAGAKVYFCAYQKKILHAKLCVIDNYLTIVGSTNLDVRSFKHSYEINAIINDKDFAKKVKDHLGEDLSESRPVKLEDLSERSLRDKILAKFLWMLRNWL